MANNSEISIDDLIKRIYKSYVDIKVGEFREIDRDMLLDDIGLLYSNVKNLYPKNDNSLIELDLQQRKIEPIEFAIQHEPIEESTPAVSDLVSPVEDMKVELIANTEIIAEPIQEDKKEVFDLSMFEDTDYLESHSDQKIDLVDMKSDNTSSPILKGFQSAEPEVKAKIDDFKAIPKIEEKIESKTIEREVHNSEDKKTEITIETKHSTIDVEADKKSTNSIMDFLHHEEKKESRDIYSFLDINTRIGLIELFFKGNSLELTECLVKLNKLDNREECIQVIDKFAATFGIDSREDIYKQFVNLIDRKLSY
jgi:hypothetical protein